MAARRRSTVLAGLVALAAGWVSTFTAGHTADVSELSAAPVLSEKIGVACTLDDPWALASTAAALPWATVWFGHFSGGRPYTDGLGRTLIDWRDDHVCFASRGLCQAWIEDLRGAFHDPEGDRTCLLLR